jgi:glycosyltransferase involved in cell wall biosynthesis
MRIFVLGYPSYFGGADTELWHTLRLWRRFELDVTMLPTWRADGEQQQRLDQIGVATVHVSGPGELARVPGLARGIVVSFCNGEFLRAAEALAALECQLVWVNCMTWVFEAEIKHYQRHGPFAAYVFQSDFQRRQIAPTYVEHGAKPEQFHLIRGAFCPDEFPFAPATHRPGEPFVLGRLARDDLDKWSSNLWNIYGSVNCANKRARVMAWSARLSEKCGAPPEWAETLAAHAESAPQFLAGLHCLFPLSGGARENWPRAGLEAMASGVPIVAQNDWGWREMIVHGVTGYLGSDDRELAHYAGMLAHDEELRLRVALAARDRLVHVLAVPHELWRRWKALFASLT